MDPHLVKMFLSLLCLAFAAHLIQGFRPQNDCQDPGTNCLLLRITEEKKSYKPGTKLNYYCPHKFTLKGSGELVCRRDGTWSASLPECIAPKCLPTILPPHTQVRSPMKNRRDYGIRLTLSCDYGYTSTQPGTLVCDAPEWKLEPSTFKCFPVTCSFLQNPANGYLTSNSQQYDSIVQYHCNYGYHLNGSPSRRCQNDGTWSGNEPVCEIKSCQDPGTPRKGSKKGNLQVGQTLHFSCDHCYQLRGSPTRTCQSDLSWSGHQPTCTAVTCSLLQNPANGYLTSNSQQCDSIVQYHCNYGYHLNGSPRRHCQSDGTWSGNEPVCEIKSCQDPGTPRKGSKKGNLQVGQTLHFSCDHCYQLRGSPTRTCQSDLNWSGHQPTCTGTAVTCSLLQNPANGYLTSNSQQCSSIVQYHCDYGYQLNGSPRRRCQSDGTWFRNEPVCESIVKSCQDPGTPRNGSKKGNLQVGETLQFSCDHCYQLRGSPTRTCQSDLSWSGHQPTCTAVRCSRLRHPSNGRITVHSNYCGRYSEFICNSGYQLRGSRRINCQSDGTWSAASPTCVNSPCGHPVLPQKARIRLYRGSVLLVVCKENYVTLKSGLMRCNPNHKWTIIRNALCLDPNPNIALGKPASMSSHWAKWGGPAELAVDGKRVGRFLSTNIEYGSWVKIDLLREETVSTVIVVNRRDCCVIRINGFKVSVGNNGKKPRKNAECGRRSRAKSGPMIIQCPTPLRGRYVTVYMPKRRWTTMALFEVEVYRRRQEE